MTNEEMDNKIALVGTRAVAFQDNTLPLVNDVIAYITDQRAKMSSDEWTKMYGDALDVLQAYLNGTNEMITGIAVFTDKKAGISKNDKN